MHQTKHIILHFLVNLLSLYVAALLIVGIEVQKGISTGTELETLILAALIFGLINISVKPFLRILSIPIRFFTFGLFSLVINTIVFMMITFIIPEYAITGIVEAFQGAILISVLHVVIFWFTKK